MWASTKALKDAGPRQPAPYEFDVKQPNNLARRAVDNLRPMRIVVVGAGMSGILSGILFPRFIENLELVIYDKNDAMGGTWYESRYPGVACDVPSHAYQYTFESNRAWSSYWAGGAEINAYLTGVAEKYGADKYMKLNHKAIGATWDEDAGKWTIKFERTDTGEIVTDTADIFVSAVGVFNGWKMPEIPGLGTFKGPVMHSATWKTDFNPSGKRVAVIGGGSSGIQILPQVQRTASHVDHYMKGKTWIPPMGLGGQGVAERGGDPRTPQEQLDLWAKDPKAYLEYRKGIEEILHQPSAVIYKGTDDAKMFQEMCEEHMKTKLAKKPYIFEALKPDFAPACRRLTPGPGYLEALVEDNVDFISNGIKEITPETIIAQDNTSRPVDAIICATGFSGYKLTYPIIGRNNENLQDRFNDGLPEAYMSVAPENMPNFFMFFGPNGGPGVGSTVPFLECVAGYIVKVVQKLQREWIKAISPKPQAIAHFGAFIDNYFDNTVFNDTCRAWWRHGGNGRLLAIWPGSALHGIYTYTYPRWEDYEYVLKEELSGNPFNYFGNGYTKAQLEGKNTTKYLEEAYIPVENPLLRKVDPGSKKMLHSEGHVPESTLTNGVLST